MTKQKELQAEIEKQQSARSQAQLQRSQMEGEEKRKTISHQSEQERRTAEYKARLDSELYQSKLEDQQKQIDQQLRMQHDQFLRQEEQRKRNNLQLEEEKRRTLGEQSKLMKATPRRRQTARRVQRAHACSQMPQFQVSPSVLTSWLHAEGMQRPCRWLRRHCEWSPSGLNSTWGVVNA